MRDHVGDLAEAALKHPRAVRMSDEINTGGLPRV